MCNAGGVFTQSDFRYWRECRRDSTIFAREYPQAQIYCFEPVAANFEMLQKNIAAFPQIRAFNIGLGKKTESIKIFHSDNEANFGGFSRFQAGSDTGVTSTVEIEACEDFFAREQVGPIDFIKIDTEGAEHDILTAIPIARLANAQWIVGELHEQDDFKLLDYLSAHFEIGIKKTIGKRLSMFYAKKKAAV
ncbi:MAG: FkbM family methyltransferase [Gammaproteobacteria bacterium]|nr:FkbM family methyltransferase [Gammaproteobacteria bacterium]